MCVKVEIFVYIKLGFRLRMLVWTNFLVLFFFNFKECDVNFEKLKKNDFPTTIDKVIALLLQLLCLEWKNLING